MRRTIPLVVCTALAAGCVGPEVQYRGTVGVTATPDLVYVGPGVQVIADFSEPIFYADGFYWWTVDGAWYRSSYYTGGWVHVSTPPHAILQIRQPHLYRGYRPAGYVVHRRPVPPHRVQRPVVRTRVRDHRR